MKNIKTLPLYKYVTWTCTTVCNYSCSYCTDENHDGKYRWHDSYDKILNVIKTFKEDKPLIFDMAGGEPTLWPKFINFCKDLKQLDDNIYIKFSTNSSRSIRYWKNFNAPVYEVTLSYHPEYASVEHFIEVSKILLEKNYDVVIFLLMPPNHFKHIQKVRKRIIKSNINVEIVVKLVADCKMEYDGGLIPGYTTEMIDFSNLKNSFKKTLFLPRSFLVDNKQSNIRTLINEKQNSFLGWKCAVGKEFIFIDADGKIFGTQCRAHGPIGHINTGFTIPKDYKTCPIQWCKCGSDIEISKYKDDKNV